MYDTTYKARCSSEDITLWAAAAKRTDKTLSQWIRETLTEEAVTTLTHD